MTYYYVSKLLRFAADNLQINVKCILSVGRRTEGLCNLLPYHIGASSRPHITFSNMLISYGEELLDRSSTSEFEDCTLSAVFEYLFSMFADILHIKRPSPFSAV
jgi:hypothetical protein